ncbi:MAG TPA: hypothetical protein VGI78_27915 [Acetobacteraceae bacterium]|jgi:hypothetical protein
MSGSDYTTTPKLGLYKPVFNADVGNWGAHWNSNADTLDSVTIANPVLATGSTTPRMVQDRFADPINAADYGVVGNGTTDDSAALQAALNAAALANAGGGIVSIGRMRVYLASSVTVPHNVRLTGEFRPTQANYSSGQDWYQYNSQIKLAAGATVTYGNCDHILFIAAGLYTTLPATVADANALVAKFAGTAITASSTSDAFISDCWFLGFTYGIYAATASRLNIDNCMFDCTNAVYQSNSSDVSRYHRLHCWPVLTGLIPGVDAVTNYAPLQRHGTAFHLVADTWTTLVDCFAYAYDTAYWDAGSSNSVFIGCHADYTTTNANSVAAWQFTGDFTYAKLVGCFTVAAKTGVIVNASGATGATVNVVEVIGGSFINTAHCIDCTAGAVLAHGAEFDVGTVGINFAAGTVLGSVMGCNFNGVPTAIGYASAAVQGHVSSLGNTVSNGTPAPQELNINPLTVPQATVKNPTAELALQATSGATDQKNWDLYADGSGNLQFRMPNDAFSTANYWLGVTRSGAAAQSVDVWATNVSLHGVIGLNGSTWANAIGFNGAAPPTKPTVTGAKGGNTALASLLTALAAYGLITDSSTA